MSTSTTTTYSSVLVDGKMTTTKTVTTKGPDGKTQTETFVEEHNDGKSGDTGADFFKMRIKDFREDERAGDFKGNKDGVNDVQNNKMSSSTSTSSSTVIKDGKMVTTKTVTTMGPDGKTTTETFVEEKDDDKEGQNDTDFFKMRIKDFKHDEKKEEVEFSDENEDDINDGCKSSTDEEANAEEFSKFQLDCLKTHNTYRAKHGVGSLQLSRKLCGHAQKWADKLMAENLFQHRPGQKYGENIYSSWSSTRAKIRGGDAVDSWYKEIEQHTFGEETGSMNTGHFTQVVWASSMRLGVGLAKKEGKVIVVANYDPPGNFRGRFVENVPPPL